VQAWDEDTEARDIAAFDVGVAPLADGPWERGKCGFKIIQYMAAGRPVVASAVGANRSIVQHGITGFLASTDAEWTAALRTLEGDRDLRRRMGDAGRRLVEERYSIQANVPALAACLQEAAGRRRGSAAGAPA
jgi:glycosyltransferase involved in cell wall biosynthesis